MSDLNCPVLMTFRYNHCFLQVILLKECEYCGRGGETWVLELVFYSTVNKEGERTETDDKSPDCHRRTRPLASENYNCVQNTDSCLLKSKAKSDTKQR